MHALISATKPLITWTCRDAIQECREACGGHGYLKASRLGDLRNLNDPRVTYEGDNNILLQQTSKWLLKQWDQLQNNVKDSNDMNTCIFLNNPRKSYLKSVDLKSISCKYCKIKLLNINSCFLVLLECYEWLVSYLLEETYTKLKNEARRTECLFTALNNSQVYKASLLSKVYGEYMILKWYLECISNDNIETSLKSVLKTLGLLYGLYNLDKHLIYYHEGNFVDPAIQFSRLVKDTILNLCLSLKPDAISIVDAIAPPDYAINSVLGKSDGEVSLT